MTKTPEEIIRDAILKTILSEEKIQALIYQATSSPLSRTRIGVGIVSRLMEATLSKENAEQALATIQTKLKRAPTDLILQKEQKKFESLCHNAMAEEQVAAYQVKRLLERPESFRTATKPGERNMTMTQRARRKFNSK